MERGSPENSTSSSLEQSKLSSMMPHSRSLRRMEKRPRGVDAEEQTSYMALLTGAESPEAQQIGSSFPGAPIFAPFGTPNFDAQPPYWASNGVPTTPTPLRSTTTQGTQNATNLTSCIKVEESNIETKPVSEDSAPNPNIWNSSEGDNYGYSMYDERYKALGLPVDPHLRMFNAIYGKGNAGFP